MALTLAFKKGPFNIGGCKALVVQATFDSSYAAGGESLTAAMLGFQEVLQVSIDPVSATPATLMYNYDYTNAKLMAFYPTGGDQTAPVTPAAPAIGATVPSGTTTVTSTAGQPTLTKTVTPGIAKEVASTADLSTYILRLFVIGL